MRNESRLPVSYDASPGCGTYLLSMLIGAILIGVMLPVVSGFVDGILYHDADTTEGFGDDMFPGSLVAMSWYFYSAIYGAVIGALFKASFLDRRAWFGIVWILIGIIFSFLLLLFASPPSGFITKSGELHLGEIPPSGENNIPFRIFSVAPAWFCGIVVLIGVILLSGSLWEWLRERRFQRKQYERNR
jgi:hypothetical protein